MFAYSINSFKEVDKMNGKNVLIQNNGITTYIPTCEKSTYEPNKIKLARGAEVLLNSYNQHLSLNNAFSAREINLENIMLTKEHHLEETKMFQNFNDLYPTNYLHFVESHVPEELISSQCFEEIKKIADNLSGNLTSFFGFESRLTSKNARSDYLIAVSSQKGEREALLNLIKNKELPNVLLNKQEWKNIGNLTEKWADPNSKLYNNIQGLWLEFDTAEGNNEIPVPSIFLQTLPLRIDSVEDIEKCKWVTRIAIPNLVGHNVSEKLENKFFNALKKLPKKASVFFVASMLSRNQEGIRVVVKSIIPDDIISYLESIGWKDEDDGLKNLINEIKKYSNCIRLHLNISDKIDSKIGLECFISPDQYHKGEGWEEFFNHLVEKGICLPDLKSAILNFPGVTQEDYSNEFNYESYLPSVKLPDNNFSKAIVRYISHIKISYDPGKTIEAKAYTGVRLFGYKE